jgi:hypothetical protein
MIEQALDLPTGFLTMFELPVFDSKAFLERAKDFVKFW